MIKIVTLLLVVLSFMSVQAQNAHSYQRLTVAYAYGDEVVTYQEIQFKKLGSKIVGNIVQPNTDRVLLSDIELNESQLKILDSFLSLASHFSDTPCTQKNVSSFVQYYLIIHDNDTQRIHRFCDWKNLTFFKIKQVIFGEYMQKLETKKASERAKLF